MFVYAIYCTLCLKKVCDVCGCLFVCLIAYLQNHLAEFHQISVHFALSQSSSDIAVSHVLPVLCMTYTQWWE